MARIPTQNRYPDRAGYTVLNTDTNQLEVFSDGHFVPISVLSGNVISVKDYGAIGIRNTADSTSAIQAAIDNANPYDTVIIPNGEYDTYNTITINKHINFIMLGRIYYHNNNTCFLIDIPNMRKRFFKFELYRAGQSDWTDNSIAIEIRKNVENCYIMHTSENFRYGIYMVEPNSVLVHNQFYSNHNYNMQYLYYFDISGTGFVNENIFWKPHLSGIANPDKDMTYFYINNHNSCNCNYVNYPAMEGTRVIGAELYNVNNFYINHARNENTKQVIKAVNCFNIDISTAFNKQITYDLSYTSTFSTTRYYEPKIDFIPYFKLFSMNMIKDLRNTQKLYPFVYGEFNEGNYTNIHSSFNNLSIKPSEITNAYDANHMKTGILIELNGSEFIKIISEANKRRLLIRFLDTNKLPVSDTIVKENVSTIKKFLYSSNLGYYDAHYYYGHMERYLWINNLSTIKYLFILLLNSLYSFDGILK